MTRLLMRESIRAPHDILRTLRRLSAATVALLALTFSTAHAADLRPAAAMDSKSLDEQVQDIKSDVLAIAAELSNLEEKLIFPSNTQVAVFVAFASPHLEGQDEDVDAGEPLPIDSARITIDGESVTQHVYTFKELEALSRGGVQRVYTGNLRTGQHSLVVEISGHRGQGKTFEETQTFEFEKNVDPKSLGIVLSGQLGGRPKIAIEDW